MSAESGEPDWLFKAFIGVALTVLGALAVKGCSDRDDGLNRLTILERDTAHIEEALDGQRSLLEVAFDRIRAMEIDRGKR